MNQPARPTTRPHTLSQRLLRTPAPRCVALGLSLAGLCGVLGSVGCDPPPKKNPFAEPSGGAIKPPPIESAQLPKAPPDFTITSEGPKVGFDYILVDKPDGKQRMTKALEEVKEYISDKDVPVKVDRKAKLDWVMALFAELEKQGASSITVSTETRPKYHASIKFTPQGKVKNAPACSLVATILEDRGTAVWKLSGGTASKRSKGFAGPDLSMTGDTLERRGAACKDSTNLFLSASEGVDWGLVYDLGASTKELEKVKLDTFILLLERPVAGHKVDL